MRAKLESLSLDQLRNLTSKVGIKFTVGNDKITDPDEFILVLDEADRQALESEYAKIVGKKRRLTS